MEEGADKQLAHFPVGELHFFTDDLRNVGHPGGMILFMALVHFNQVRQQRYGLIIALLQFLVGYIQL